MKHISFLTLFSLSALLLDMHCIFFSNLDSHLIGPLLYFLHCETIDFCYNFVSHKRKILTSLKRYFLLNLEVSVRTIIILSALKYIALVICDLRQWEMLKPALVRCMKNVLSPSHNSKVTKAILFSQVHLWSQIKL